MVEPRLLKAMSTGSELTHSLAGSPTPVDVVLTTGKKRYCMTFNGKQRFFTTNSPAPAAGSP